MIVIARSYGQLGNRLFLYAHMIAAGCEYNVDVANPCFAEYAHLFPSTANDLWCRYRKPDSPAVAPSLWQRKLLAKSIYLNSRVLSWLPTSICPLNVIRLKGDRVCDLASPEFATLAREDRLLLAQGWLFRSEELFQRHANAIREHFQILPAHRANVDRAIDRIRQSADVVVGVHIRHGDYATFQGGRYFYSVAQYADAMRQIVQQIPDRRVAFLVCSNAKTSPADFDGLQVQMGPGHMIEDMYSFAMTDLLIGPPSTYTAWASFYGQVPLCVLESADQSINLQAIQPASRQVA